MRAISTSQAVLTALRERNRAQSRRSSDTSLIVPPSDTPTLQTVDYTARLPDKEYDEQLAEWQSRLARLAQHDKFRDTPVVLVFEGQDAAGKGGTISRITNTEERRVGKKGC